jgi:hypothetical protein
MADKSVGELIAAQSVTPTDLFVLEQNGTAKKLTGQILENWLVSFADGHGGIQSIDKLGTSGLADTYRITLADTTTFDFVVTNGRGISSITKTTTEGMVDTYIINYNDSTSATFTVTNGEKGDKGDNQYVWIKYASQEPTASSHSFGDVADNWMGIYSGDSATAPTDWQQYTWFEIKGEKGDTGADATLTSSKVEYQASDSGTIIPSGVWSASVPVVAQGKYLWTRTTNTFNTGSPVISYSVSRMGLDGSGSVSSVANINPDENGNVPLTATDINALPSTGGDLTGELRMNGQPISGLNVPTTNDQAANMGFVNQQVKKAAPRNLLDNSDFTDPVNQRGATTTAAWAYCIDRWVSRITGMSLQNTRDGLTITSANAESYIYQKISNPEKLLGKKCTAAVCEGNGNITITSFTFPDSIPTAWTTIAENTEGNVHLYILGSNSLSVGVGPNDTVYEATIKWVALYEGEYTIDTLPEYHPKGYCAELAECQRYYRRYSGALYTSFGTATARSSTVLALFFDLGNIRTNPTFVFSGSLKVYGDKIIGGLTMSTDTFSSGIKRVNIDGDNFTTGYSYLVAAETDTIIEFSADL